MSGPKVLVLMAAFNGARWIREQIESILSQDGVAVHLIVSDDGSSDNTREEIARFTQNARVQLIARSAPSGSAAQNFFSLIRNTSSDGFDFVAFADQDDLWDQNKLQRAANALSASAAVGYSSAVTAVWDNGRKKILLQSESHTPGDFLFEGAGQGCTFVLRADFYRCVRDFLIAQQTLTQNIHYHDWAVYCLARAWKHEWKLDPRPSVTYRQHGGNDTGARNSVAGVAKRLNLIRRGWYSSQLVAIAQLAFSANPSSSTVSMWHSLVRNKHCGLGRRLRVARFCMTCGRRRFIDSAILVLAGLAGWI